MLHEAVGEDGGGEARDEIEGEGSACGVGADGMPIGMQMIGPKFSEATLLRTAANYEKICGGFGSVADLD